MKSLVTGSSGFVGRHLVQLLTELGDDVVALDRSDGCDIRNRPAVYDAFADQDVDVVYHLAGQADVAASWNEPTATQRVNVEGTMNVLQAANDAGVSRAIIASSATVYGNVQPDALPITEDLPPNPVSPYAASKVGAEAVARFVNESSGPLKVVIARPFNHIGRGQQTNFVAPGLASRIARTAQDGGGVIDVGSLEPTRDFLDVADVVSAYRHLIEDGLPGEAYNICSGTETPIAELADTLVQISGADISFAQATELLRPADLPRLCGDNLKLVEATGWRPKVSLEESLRSIYAEQCERLSKGAPRNEAR